MAELFPRKPKPKARYYIKFSAWDEQLNQLREKIVWLPSKLNSDKERRAYAATKIAKINKALLEGKCFDFNDPTPLAKTLIEPKPKSLFKIAAIVDQLETKKVEVRNKSEGTYKVVFSKLKKFVKSTRNGI